MSVKAEIEGQGHIKVKARENVKLEAQGNVEKEDREDTKERIEVDAQEDTNDELEEQVQEAQNETKIDTKKRSKKWQPRLRFVDDRSHTMCNAILGFESQSVETAIDSFIDSAPLDPLLAKIVVCFGAEESTLELAPFCFSLLDLVQTQMQLQHIRVFSGLAAERVISFCPHLVTGNILLRIISQTTLDMPEVRRSLGYNGFLLRSSCLAHRRVRQLGGNLRRQHRNTHLSSAADQWYTTNLNNFNAYAKFFRDRARLSERFMLKAICEDILANTDVTKPVPTVTKYNQMETVQGGVVIYRPYMKRIHSKSMNHTSIKRSASDEDLEALRKRIKVEKQE